MNKNLSRNSKKINIVFLILFLACSSSVYALQPIEDSSQHSFCNTSGWNLNPDIKKLIEVGFISFSNESLQGKLYTNKAKEIISIINIYSPIIKGKIVTIFEDGLKKTNFYYHIHSNTEGKIDGATALIVTKHNSNYDLVGYCYQRLNKKKDFAKKISSDILSVVIEKYKTNKIIKGL
ncbi:MAG: hypothetical protein KAH22_09780 [Thiotrichaceae bacterium]|nr:hypothetical protein [Thiotrichaceae bacterium]